MLGVVCTSLLDLKVVRLPAACAGFGRAPGHRQGGCVLPSLRDGQLNSRPSGRVMTSPQSRVMRPDSLWSVPHTFPADQRPQLSVMSCRSPPIPR